MSAPLTSMMLGDMQVSAGVPPKLLKALAVIAQHLHPVYARQPWIAHPDKSKESCVLCSLTVRDFLFQIGFKDVVVRPVMVLIQAIRVPTGELIHSLGIGVPEDTRIVPGRWAGHMVVHLPNQQLMIDTTLYGARRPQWADLPGMLAVPIPDKPPSGSYHGLPMIVGIGGKTEVEDFGLFYFDRPELTNWRSGDGSPSRRDWRNVVVKELIRAFDEWAD